MSQPPGAMTKAGNSATPAAEVAASATPTPRPRCQARGSDGIWRSASMATKNAQGRSSSSATTLVALSQRTAWPLGPPTVSSMKAHTASAAKATMPSANIHCRGRRGRPASAMAASARLLTAAMVGTSICIDIRTGSSERSIELGQRAPSIREVAEVALRARRGRERLPRAVLVADLRVGHAEVILDGRVAGDLGGAFLEQRDRPLIDAALVQDPPEGVRDTRVVGRRLLRRLRELQRLFLVAAVLGIEPGEVIGGGREARIDAQRRGIGLLRPRDVAPLLVHEAQHHQRRQVLRGHLVRLVELRDGLLEILAAGVDGRQVRIAGAQPR